MQASDIQSRSISLHTAHTMVYAQISVLCLRQSTEQSAQSKGLVANGSGMRTIKSAPDSEGNGQRHSTASYQPGPRRSASERYIFLTFV